MRERMFEQSGEADVVSRMVWWVGQAAALRFRASQWGQHFHVAQYQFPFIEPSDWITGVLMSTPVEPWPG